MLARTICIRSDGEGTVIGQNERLLRVLGAANMVYRFAQEKQTSLPIAVLLDEEGFLTVFWTDGSTMSQFKSIIEYAWNYVGFEPTFNIDHILCCEQTTDLLWELARRAN